MQNNWLQCSKIQYVSNMYQLNLKAPVVKLVDTSDLKFNVSMQKIHLTIEK